MSVVEVKGFIKVPKNKIELVTQHLDQHILLTKQEIGCLDFQVRPKVSDPTIFDVYEKFIDSKAFVLHQHRTKQTSWADVTQGLAREYQVTGLVKSHEYFMQHCLELAKQAESEGEVPVGAVVVYEDEIIAQAYNQPITKNDPSAHAEMLALRKASLYFENYRLPENVTLYVTLEPCPMCAGLMVHSRLTTLVFGTKDPRTGSAGSAFDLLNGKVLNHQVDCISDVLQQECSQQLKSFFKKKR